MTTQLQAVRHLEDEFVEAMSRLYTVGNGLARLRAELDRQARSAAPSSSPTPAPPAPPTPAPSAAPGPAAQPAPAAPVSLGRSPFPAPTLAPPPFPPSPGGQAAPPPRWWQREGAVIKVLVITGAVVTLAGVTMLLTYAMQHGWFGPPARVAGGAVLAAALVWAAHRVRAHDAASGRSTAAPVAIAATGYAAAYLDIVAMTTVYAYVPSLVGLVLAGVLATTGLLLARRWDSELLAVITVLGAAVLGPVVAGEVSWVVSAFLFVLAAAAAPAQLGRSWPALDASRTTPVALLLLAAVVAAEPGSADRRILLGLVAGFAALAVVTALRPITDFAESVLTTILAIGAVVPLLVAVALLERTGRTVGYTVTAAAYLCLAVLGGRVRMTSHLRAALGSIGTVSVVLAVASGAPEQHIGTGLLISAAAYLAASGATHSRLTLALGAAVTVLAGASYLPRAASVLGPSLAVEHPALTLVDSLLAAAMVAVLVWALAVVPGLPAQVRALSVPVAWAGGLTATVTTSVSAGVLVGQSLDLARAGFVAGHAVATLAWMGAAVWLLGRGLKRARDAGLALRVGLVLAAVSVAKLFLFDLASLAGLWRIAAFIGTGLLLLVAGTGYARAVERSRSASPAVG